MSRRAFGGSAETTNNHVSSCLLARGAGDGEVGVVDWIEGAAENTDAAQVTHESDRRPG